MVTCDRCGRPANDTLTVGEGGTIPLGFTRVAIANAGQLSGRSVLLCADCTVDLTLWISSARAEQPSPEYVAGVLEAFSALSSWRCDDDEIRRLCAFARQRRRAPGFEPCGLVMRFLTEPAPTRFAGQER